MGQPVSKKELTTRQRKELLEPCGPDAQDHPLERVNGQLRFQADPVISYLHRCCILKTDKLWAAMDMNVSAHRLSIRRLYRDMGCSLTAYMDLFGDQLEEERIK